MEKMNNFTLPETKLFIQRTIQNLIRDVVNEKNEAKKKWDLTFQAMQSFDQAMTIENCEVLKLCKGTKNPGNIADKIKFGILAENFLRKHLLLILVDDMPIDEQADVHHEKYSLLMEMRNLDFRKAGEIVSKLDSVATFKKLGDNNYMVGQKHKNLD